MKGIKKRFVFVLLLLISCKSLFAQEKKTDCCTPAIDSLLLVLKGNKEDSSKVITLLAIAWNKFNLAWSRNGDYESAIQYAKEGLALTEKLKFKWGKGRANFVLGRCFELKADYTESLKHHFTALKISLEMGNKVLTLVEYYDIGKIYNRMANYPEALKYFFASLKVVKEIKADNWLAGIQARIGTVYFNQENHDEAQKYFTEAYSIAEKRQEKLTMAEILSYKGNLSLSQGKYDDALHDFSASLKLYEQSPIKSYIASNYDYIAKAYIMKAAASQDSLTMQKYYYEAIQYLQKALLLQKEMGGKEEIINTYSLLSEAFRGINDYKNALTYSDLYTQSRDATYNKPAYVKIAELKVQYETEKAAAEMKAQQKLERIEEDALRDKMLADQKLEQEKILADERVDNEKVTAEQKLEQEKAMVIAGEKANYEKSIAIEKISTEKQQTNNLLLMGLILVVITSLFLILYFQQRNQKKRAIEKAETIHQMAELEMQSIRSQLNPHFIFNSLNSIQTLILKEETDKSQSYLSQFARLLRMLLENADKPFIPLRKEIEFLQLYVGLEGLRVPDMQYSFSTDPALNTEQILIPNMFLQPYVENAIWHGLSHKETDKQLQIRIFSENGTVNYEIEDNGVGIKKAEELKSTFHKQHQSKGMELLSKRIKLLNSEYSSTIQTQITDVIKNNEVAGTLVTIKIPVRLFEPLQN